jgi:hypothetical protein
MHAQFPEHDAMISEWIAKQGWPIAVRHYDFDREVLAWRAAGVTPRITLRVSQTICEDVPTHVLVSFSDNAKLAVKLALAPDRYTIVMRGAATGATIIKQFPSAP